MCILSEHIKWRSEKIRARRQISASLPQFFRVTLYYAWSQRLTYMEWLNVKSVCRIRFNILKISSLTVSSYNIFTGNNPPVDIFQRWKFWLKRGRKQKI